MSITYTDDQNTQTETAFVPSYARRSARPKKVRTWMVLAPIGAIALIGGGALMLMNGPSSAPAPLAEPAAPAVASLPVNPAVTPMTNAMTPLAPLATPTPVEAAQVTREVAPAPRTAPVRRAAPVVRAEPTTPPTPRIETPAEPTGPRAYSASPAVTPSTSAPVTAPAAPPAPAISVQPLN